MIALIGFTGAGKSTLGAHLQIELDIPCYDVDAMIEDQQKMKIAEIFAVFGEASFRRLEADMICSCGGRSAGVIVTGGGAVLDADVRQWLSRNCLVVHVHAPLDVIIERVGFMRDRPLLGQSDPERALRTLYEVRRGIYDFADIEVDGTHIDEAAAAIVGAWREWRRAHS